MPPDEAIDAAARRGVELGDHRSKGLTAPLLERADLIVVMAPDHARSVRARFGAPRSPMIALGDLDPINTGDRSIHDPIRGTPDVFDACYARIDRCLDELVGLLVPR